MNVTKLPYLSIVIATKNAGESLRVTLNSILKVYSSFSFEIVVIDGLSTDNRTIEVIKEFEASLAYWVSEQDMGVYDAWNKALRKVKGQYVTFLGAGDIVLTNYFRLFHQRAVNHQEDFIYCRQQQRNPNGGTFRIIGKPFNRKKLQTRMAVTHIGSWHSMLAFQTFGMFDDNYQVCADYAWILGAGDNLSVGFIPEVLVESVVGGLSDSGYLVFKETKEIRSKFVTRNVVNLYFWYWESIFRKWIRKLILQ